MASLRPFTRVLHRASLPNYTRRAAVLHPVFQRNLFIQTASTPNPSALKFLPGQPVLPASHPGTMEFLSGRSATGSPLARKLFAVDGVTSVFYGPDFITVTKADEANWAHIKPEVFALITETLSSGEPVVAEDANGTGMAPDTAPQEGDSEVVEMIKELLDTRIRPSIQEDGGDLEYMGFDEETGIVKLKLRGACRTCDSSTVTLTHGIESMLMHYVSSCPRLLIP